MSVNKRQSALPYKHCPKKYTTQCILKISVFLVKSLSGAPVDRTLPQPKCLGSYLSCFAEHNRYSKVKYTEKYICLYFCIYIPFFSCTNSSRMQKSVVIENNEGTCKQCSTCKLSSPQFFRFFVLHYVFLLCCAAVLVTPSQL